MRPRPGIVVGLAFAVVLLVPLWAAYGMIGGGGGGGHAGHGGGEAHGGHGGGKAQGGGGHAGHDGGGGSEDAKQAFMDERKAFVAKNMGVGGCVWPPIQPMSMEGMDHEGMDMEGMDHGEEAPTVILEAVSWTFLPQKLCLERGVTYNFKMMATDVTHGASIETGRGSSMMRLPAGQQVEQKITFSKPGRYLVYCSYYCGIGHSFMAGRIIVE